MKIPGQLNHVPVYDFDYVLSTVVTWLKKIILSILFTDSILSKEPYAGSLNRTANHSGQWPEKQHAKLQR